MSAFTRDEIIAQLVAQNIPRHMAERAADRELTGGGPVYPLPLAGRHGGKTALLEELTAAGVGQPLPPWPIAWPVRILLPWSYLVSDNERKEPYVVHTANGPRARMRLTAKYAAALEKVANVARNKIGDAAPYTGPLGIRGLVYVPDERPHDVSNFEKLTHDALEGVLYTNDRWLHDVHWTRAGVDVDAPRAEICITPLLPNP